MSTSSYVIGFMAPTEDYRKKVASWRACDAAGITPPKELIDLFDDTEPEDLGMLIEIIRSDAVKAYKGDCESGYEIEVAKLPPGVTHVRFIVSY